MEALLEAVATLFSPPVFSFPFFYVCVGLCECVLGCVSVCRVV